MSDAATAEGQEAAAGGSHSQQRLVSLADLLSGKVRLETEEDIDGTGASATDGATDGATDDPTDLADPAVDPAATAGRGTLAKPLLNLTGRTGRILDPEVWMDYWSDELLTLWHGLKEHSEAMGAAVLDTCEFASFVQFCWYHSSRYPPAA